MPCFYTLAGTQSEDENKVVHIALKERIFFVHRRAKSGYEL